MKVFFTSIDRPASKYDDFVQGDACLIVTGRYTSQVMAHGRNNLGRLVWVTLRGRQHECLTVVSMYRPNPGSNDSGQTTVWAQQRARMQEIATNREEVCHVDPRTACLKEFQEWAQIRKDKGGKLVVLAEANQSLTDTK